VVVDEVVDVWTAYRPGRERGTQQAFERGAGDGAVVRVRGVPLVRRLAVGDHVTVGGAPVSGSTACSRPGVCEPLTVPPPVRSDGQLIVRRHLSAAQLHLWKEDPEGDWRVRNLGLNPVHYQRWGHRFDESMEVSSDPDGTVLAGRTTLWLPDGGARRRLLVVPRGAARRHARATPAMREAGQLKVDTPAEPSEPMLAPLPRGQLTGLISLFPEHLSFPGPRNPRVYGRRDLGGRYDSARGAVRQVIRKLDDIGWRHPKMVDTDGRPLVSPDSGRTGTEDVIRIEVLEELLARSAVRFDDVAAAARAARDDLAGLYLLDSTGAVIIDGRGAARPSTPD